MTMQCLFCPKRFVDKRGLTAHVRIGHAKQYAAWRKGGSQVSVDSAVGNVDTPPIPINTLAHDDESRGCIENALKLLTARRAIIQQELTRYGLLEQELADLDRRMQSLLAVLDVWDDAVPEPTPLKVHGAHGSPA